MKRALFALAFTVAVAGTAAAEDTWEGTWVGDAPDVDAGVQLIFVRNALVGFIWAGDPLDVRASLSRADGVITITWTRGQALLTRQGPNAAHLHVYQRGGADVPVTLRPED